MKGKKETKTKNVKPQGEEGAAHSEGQGKIVTKADLKSFLQSVRDKMVEGLAAPIYALSAINHVMALPDVYDLLDADNKELARDIWLRLKQAGMQVKNPPMLFSAEESNNSGAAV